MPKGDGVLEQEAGGKILQSCQQTKPAEPTLATTVGRSPAVYTT